MKKKLLMNIFAALDLETTGLDPAHCEVLELAIVPLNEDFTISRIFPNSLPVSRHSIPNG